MELNKALLKVSLVALQSVWVADRLQLFCRFELLVVNLGKPWLSTCTMIFLVKDF